MADRVRVFRTIKNVKYPFKDGKDCIRRNGNNFNMCVLKTRPKWFWYNLRWLFKKQDNIA